MNEKLLRSSFRYKEQDPDYKGERCDESLGEGPNPDRRCTDLLCCLLFLALIAAMGYVASIAFSTGDPRYLVYPFDSNGQQCGMDEGYKDFPLIFIGEYPLGQVNYVCVSSCPTQNLPNPSCRTGKALPDCSFLVTYPTEQIATYCLPTDLARQVAGKIVTQILSVGVLQGYFADLYVGWKLILAAVGVSLVVSIIYSVLIRSFAGCMVWTMIFILMILQLVLGLSCAFMSDLKVLRDFLNYDDLPEPMKDPTYQKILAGICLLAFSICFLAICCLRKQIRVAVGIIKAAADFVRNCCSAFLLPFYVTILQLLFLAAWITVILFLFSSNTGKIEPMDGFPFAMVDWNTQNQRLIIFYIFGLLWIINFLAGVGFFWTSSAAAIWYFQEGKPQSPILSSICRSFYHFGSIAFGSLLIALVMFVRIVLQFLNNQLKQKTMGMAEGKAIGFAMKCAGCLIACFQRVVRFITENAYIMLAINGKSFCTSARQAFYLMVRQAPQFFVSNGTAKLFAVVGTALIVTACCTSGYLFITNIEPYKYQIQSPVFLTILFAIAALPVAWAFMEFFQKAANTILMCYCVEMDLNKKNYKCPSGMKHFMREYQDQSGHSQYGR